MRDALANIAQTTEQLVDLEAIDVVLDIGCNDGTLLNSYKTENLFKIGFDPAQNLAQYSRQVADEIVTDFFSSSEFYKHFTEDERPKIITSIAMFYDLEDPNQFVRDIKEVLLPEGVWVLQMSYLPLMLKQHDFGNICHEHLEYYSLKSLEYLLDRHDMSVFDVQVNDVNGGSIRALICNRGMYETNASVWAMRTQEERLDLGNVASYFDFYIKIQRIKHDVVNFIEGEIEKGKLIGVYGASTKGNVMLQYFGLDHKLICLASDRNPDKWGRVTIGTRIPIMSEEDARNIRPDYFLILPWHFINEFVEREKAYLNGGGRFIVPLPHFTLI